MKRTLTRMLLSLVVLATSSSLLSAAGSNSISINFGAEEPNGAGSAVNGPAGVLGSAHWNNLTGNTGSASNLIDDTNSATTAAVNWTSNNTWASQGRGEENNTAPAGNDRNLMTGYLDTNATDPVRITLTGLPFSGLYDVYVYTKGGVNGRGGDYTVASQTQNHVDSAAFDGTYEFGAAGDVLLFSGISGSTFDIVAQPSVGNPFRAPVNGIEIRAVPEPTSGLLLSLGALALRRGRRRS